MTESSETAGRESVIVGRMGMGNTSRRACLAFVLVAIAVVPAFGQGGSTSPTATTSGVRRTNQTKCPLGEAPSRFTDLSNF